MSPPPRLPPGWSPDWEAAPPVVRRLAHPQTATELLGPLLGGVQVREVTPLREHAGSRWTLRLAARSEGGERPLVAKVYARERPDVARTLAALRRGGLGGPLGVPAPLVYAPGWRLLLVEEAPGVPARDLLRRGEPGVGERAAGWLAALHGPGAPLPSAYRMRDPLPQARRWAAALGEHAPPLRDTGRRLLARLEAAQPVWPPPPHLIHGDFVASHVFLTPARTTVIDWDSWGVGDPAQDAGRFLGSLRHLAARDPALAGPVAEEAQAFTCRYLEAVPAARRALPFYEALACLRKAARLAAKGRPGRTAHAAALLGAAGRALGS
ncbi:phosphotransferase family protein [Deinococcus planocerae]|uniref:phosphotransferase family protein n=1 Tax=Deinococcus planocerae TaxID=1737569 RepID=UPI000C7EE10F|nr:phosphotransferase [Deinococcus planocerae]